MFDYLVVGAGLTGAVMTRELVDAGRRVLVIDQRQHIGGQCYTETRDGQTMSLYGGHIFHTSDAETWAYVQRFAEWRQYSHRVKASAGGMMYSFPPNRMTYQQLGTDDPDALRAKFFTGYTEKMWGRPIDKVPESVLARIPRRDDWDDAYFSDRWQAMPEGGYTPMIDAMLAGAVLYLGADYLADRWELDQLARRVIYTGPIDALFGCDAGRLEWRGLRFEHWRHDAPTYQGAPTVNYCDADTPWLRDEEWRFFWRPAQPRAGSWVTRTYPDNGAQYYPVNDAPNDALADEYKQRAAAAGYLTAGRLADYRYYDMHQAIARARMLARRELSYATNNA